jgi:hypothetical protein
MPFDLMGVYKKRVGFPDPLILENECTNEQPGEADPNEVIARYVERTPEQLIREEQRRRTRQSRMEAGVSSESDDSDDDASYSPPTMMDYSDSVVTPLFRLL